MEILDKAPATKSKRVSTSLKEIEVTLVKPTSVSNLQSSSFGNTINKQIKRSSNTDLPQNKHKKVKTNHTSNRFNNNENYKYQIKYNFESLNKKYKFESLQSDAMFHHLFKKFV